MNKKMNKTNIVFEPFVGKDYNDAFYGKKILVLGESHYCSEAEVRPTLTTEVLNRLWDDKCEFGRYMNTFTKFAHALDGEKVSRKESKRVWDKVIFYNYVQCALSDTRTAPTEEQIEASKDALLEVLEKYRPERIIVWGKRLYSSLPPVDKECKQQVLDVEEFFPEEFLKEHGDEPIENCGDKWSKAATKLAENEEAEARAEENRAQEGQSGYKTKDIELSDGTKIPMLEMDHPSTGYPADDWHKIIEEFIKKGGNR